MSFDQDSQFFTDHADRQARIRVPSKQIVINKQRGTNIVDEMQGEFWSLGDHDKSRRRVLVWRVPADNPHFNPDKPQLMKIPFLLFADESVEDRDDVLLPLIHELMMEQARKETAVDEHGRLTFR